MFRVVVTACGCACLCLFQAGHADDTLESGIVITPTRTPTSETNVNATVITFDRPEIEASQAQDLTELLRFTAGIELGRNGGPGQTASLFIRGAESDHTLVLVDGVKINAGTVGLAALTNINLSAVERVEVVKGPRSTLYGSEAIGGVIQIFTRRPEQGTVWDASVETGSDATREVRAGFARQSAAWRGGLDISYYATDGFPARVGASADSGHDNATINAYAGLTGPVDLELRHWQSTGNTEYFSFDLQPNDQDFYNSVSALSASASPGQNWRSKAILSHIQDKIDQNQSTDFAHTERTVLDWQNDITLSEKDLLSAGLYVSHEKTASAVFGSGFDVTTDVYEGYLQWQRGFGPHDLLLALRGTDHETFGTHSTGELSWGYRVIPALRVRAALASGFRAPDSTDRFGFGGNPDLKPERSRNTEAGLVWTPSASHRLEASVFQNDIDNLIVFTDPDGFDGPLPGTNQNLAETRTTGLELSYRTEHGPWWLQSDLVLQDPKDRSTGMQLPRRARRALTLKSGYQRGGYGVMAEMIATSKRPDSAFSDVINPGYTLFNLSAQRRFNKHWTLRGRIENVFDEDYVLADGFNTRGRAGYIQIAYQNR